MGVSTRPYMQRPIDPPAVAVGDVPTWETMADALRVRLYDLIEHAPFNTIQEACGLVDALGTLQAIHGRGVVYDKADECKDR